MEEALGSLLLYLVPCALSFASALLLWSLLAGCFVGCDATDVPVLLVPLPLYVLSGLLIPGASKSLANLIEFALCGVLAGLIVATCCAARNSGGWPRTVAARAGLLCLVCVGPAVFLAVPSLPE